MFTYSFKAKRPCLLNLVLSGTCPTGPPSPHASSQHYPEAPDQILSPMRCGQFLRVAGGALQLAELLHSPLEVVPSGAIHPKAVLVQIWR